MKLRKKFWSMVLCLSLSFGFTAMAEDNILSGIWIQPESSSGASENGGTLTLPLANSAAIGTDLTPVIKGTAYQLTFTYSLTVAEKGSVKVCGFSTNDDTAMIGAVVLRTKLPVGTNATYKIEFTPREIRNGVDVKFVKVNFESIKVEDSLDNFTVNNVVLSLVQGDAIVTNGSAEIVKDGAAVGIIGGTLIENTDEAQSGENMMQVAAGETMHIPLALDGAASLAKIRGFLKAETSFTEYIVVTVFIKDNNKDGTVLAAKSFNIAKSDATAEAADEKLNINSEEWELFRFSAIKYTTNLVLSVKVEGAGSVYVDGIIIENDKNLVRNAAFIPEGATDVDGNSNTWAIELTRLNELLNKNGANVYLNESYTNPTTNEVIPAVTANGNCPDGQNYIEASGYESGSMVLLRTRSPITVQEGEKYRISLWLKTEGTKARIGLDGQTASIKANYPGWNQFIMDIGTNGKWKQVEFTLTVPKGLTSFNLNLRTQGAVGSDKKVSFNMPVVEKIVENEVGFYVQEFENAPSDAGGVSVVAPKLERYGYAFQNVLGTPLETATGFTGTITAVAITVAPQATSNNMVIMAAYAKDRNGSKKLVNVKVGVAPGAPTWTTTVTDADGNTVTGVNYPSVTMHTDEISDDVDEISAFTWNNLSDLNPVGTYASITR